MGETLKGQIDSLRWWHSIKIGDYVSNGENKEVEDTFNNLPLPPDISGKSVIDIGCWDGYYSFMCEELGAGRVVACDKYIWESQNISGETYWTKDKGFDLAKKYRNSNVEKLVASVEELDPDIHGKFDIVLMLGVIYHAKDPIGYMQKAFDMSNDLVIFESHVDMQNVDFPAARYYINDELNNDNTNYWGMNDKAICGIMKDIGYQNIKHLTLRTGRMVFSGTVR